MGQFNNTRSMHLQKHKQYRHHKHLWPFVQLVHGKHGQAGPTGWHVPTDAEWTTLENYLIANGYNYDGTTTGNKYAKALASATGWNYYSGTGTVGNTDYPAKRNATGFTALPGGFRGFDNGAFSGVGSNGGWWSSSGGSTYNAWSGAWTTATAVLAEAASMGVAAFQFVVLGIYRLFVYFTI